MKKEFMTDEKMIKVCVGMVEQEGFVVEDFTKELMLKVNKNEITPDEGLEELKKYLKETSKKVDL